MLLALCCCASGCAERDTFVEVGLEEGQAPSDGTFIAIEGYYTPVPIVTPAPTAPPASEPQSSGEEPREEEREERDDREVEEDRGEEPDRDEEREEERSEATPAPTEAPKKSGTPYANSYTRVDVDYESGSRGISFDTTTLSGASVSESIFSRADLTMITAWTRT